MRRLLLSLFVCLLLSVAPSAPRVFASKDVANSFNFGQPPLTPGDVLGSVNVTTITSTTTVIRTVTLTSGSTTTLTQETTTTVNSITTNEILAVIVGAAVVASAAAIGGYQWGQRRARKALLGATR